MCVGLVGLTIEILTWSRDMFMAGLPEVLRSLKKNTNFITFVTTSRKVVTISVNHDKVCKITASFIRRPSEDSTYLLSV